MRSLVAALLVIGAAAPLQAQIRVSAAYGYMGPGTAGDTDHTHGITIGVAAEKSLVPQVVAGIEAQHWQSSSNGSQTTFLTALLKLYPLPNFGGYGLVGFGYGTAHMVAPTVTYSHDNYDVSGPAVQFEVGYDFTVAPGLALGAFVGGTNTVGNSAQKYVHVGSGNATLFNVGVSAKFAIP
ncbi:MAG TPA: hypothetical protein VFT41_12800 [Gemmatimonadaceae bacterium]|nr:hypothetical protein [Gemmatimonadaceae bacterium]